jgi:putative flippase GtrA
MTVISPRGPFLRFAAVGLVNTAVGLALIYTARAFGLGEVSANATGYAVGVLISFGLNRHWTFRHRGPLLPSTLKFSAVLLMAWFANLAVLLGLMRLGVTAALAQAAAVLPYVLVSYLGCRWWAFTNSQAEWRTASHDKSGDHRSLLQRRGSPS